MSPSEAKQMMYCKDEEAPASRPPSMLFGLAWFLYEYLPSSQKESEQAKRKKPDDSPDSPAQKLAKQ